MDENWVQYVLIALILGAMFWNMSRRKKQTSGNVRVDAAAAMVTEINENLKIMEERLNIWQSKKKFATRGWTAYQAQLDFLDSAIVSALSEAYTTAEDFNSRIDSARKNNVMATLQDMQVEKLRGPLTKAKEGLTNWLRTNYQSEMQNTPRRRGCLGM
jgi:hypothetical protein